MADMDLIPSDFRHDRQRRRWLRNFMLTCLLLMCLIGLARGVLAYLSWRGTAEIAGLQRQEGMSEQHKARTEAYRRQKAALERQLATLDELRGQDRVGALLQAIDTAYVAGVWFNSVRFTGRGGAATLKDVPGAAASGIIVVPSGAEAARKAAAVRQEVGIVGHAVDHSLLAEFMRKLGQQPGVAELRLLDSSLRNYAPTQVVDFNLALHIDKKGPTAP